ncbi:hypothetical protein [Sporomusa malonica]|uniref:Uncharacterized protein n=1 Tax=Sporomusa malonica TaxID=112901 RepID=A0A1W1YG35_9FIRM|nr:hypothetical protein [Sporomusa malonica]SMC35127.1 hypothetical protein SAMN04488500_101335 [Sporomusa malonica]
MNKCQQYFVIIIPIIMLMTAVQPVLAAVELSVEDCTALALKNNYEEHLKQNWNRPWVCR